jgi:hypothetical protein
MIIVVGLYGPSFRCMFGIPSRREIITPYPVQSHGRIPLIRGKPVSTSVLAGTASSSRKLVRQHSCMCCFNIQGRRCSGENETYQDPLGEIQRYIELKSVHLRHYILWATSLCPLDVNHDGVENFQDRSVNQYAQRFRQPKARSDDIKKVEAWLLNNHIDAGDAPER